MFTYQKRNWGKMYLAQLVIYQALEQRVEIVNEIKLPGIERKKETVRLPPEAFWWWEILAGSAVHHLLAGDLFA
jgi:hypothetical protein